MSTTLPRPAIANCSFCQRPNTEVAKLVAGPGVFICDNCVATATDIISGASPASPGMAPWDHDMPVASVLELLAPVAAAEQQAGRTLGLWVAKARGLGASWAQIGHALGITRQSAWGRFSGEE